MPEQTPEELGQSAMPQPIPCNGYVQEVSGDTAVLRVETPDGRQVTIEWPAHDLEQKGIGERSPFTMTPEGDTFSFAPRKAGEMGAALVEEMRTLFYLYEKAGVLDLPPDR